MRSESELIRLIKKRVFLRLRSFVSALSPVSLLLKKTRSQFRKQRLPMIQSNVPQPPEFMPQILNKSQLAKALGRHRSYIAAMVSDGYQLEFGTRTSLSHALEWLRENQNFRSTGYFLRKARPHIRRDLPLLASDRSDAQRSKNVR